MFTKETYRFLADLLTASRALIGIVLWAYVIILPEALPVGVIAVLIVIGWTSDMLDGYFGRRSGNPGGSWWARQDFFADLLLTSALAVVVVRAGAVPGWVIGVALVGVVLIDRTTGQRAPINLLQGFVDGSFIYHLLVVSPLLGRGVVLWLLAVLLIDRKRFMQNARRFVNGMVSLVKRESER